MNIFKSVFPARDKPTNKIGNRLPEPRIVVYINFSVRLTISDFKNSFPLGNDLIGVILLRLMRSSTFWRLHPNMAVTSTAILISHRVGFARLADRIILLSGGKVAEVGTHDELMAKNGLYATFFNEQAQWYQKDAEETEEAINA